MKIVPKIIYQLCVLGAATMTLILMQPPRPLPRTASGDQFAAHRALDHLKHIAAKPHPVGTTAHAGVRNYIVKEMTSLGYEVTVQDHEASNQIFGWIRGAKVHNIIARRPSSYGDQPKTANPNHTNSKHSAVKKRDGAIAIVAHYDSVPQSFGACDDGAAVAAMIETARVLTNLEPKKRSERQHDIVFLFTDAEEVALVGATAMLDHPVLEDIGVILNFEARGCDGPVAMYQSAAKNDLLIRQFAKATPRPIASSLIRVLSKILPNCTDVDVFNTRGIPYLNFAFADGLHRYHTPKDAVNSLDLRSLQHQGSYMLSLIRSFQSADIDLIQSANQHSLPRIYADIAGRFLIHYNAFVARCIMVALLLIGVILLKTKATKLGPITISFAVALASIVLCGALIYAINLGLSGLPLSLIAAKHKGLAVAYMIIIGLILSSIFRRLRARHPITDIYAGILLLWVLLALTTTILAPEASYLFSWSSIAGLLIFAGIEKRATENKKIVKSRKPIRAAVLSVSGYILLSVVATEFIYLLAGMSSGTLSVPLAIVITLFLLLFMPLVSDLRPSSTSAIDRMHHFSSQFWTLRKVTGLVALVISTGLYAAVLFTKPTDDTPIFDTVNYVVDADQNLSFWTRRTASAQRALSDSGDRSNEVIKVGSSRFALPPPNMIERYRTHSLYDGQILTADAPKDSALFASIDAASGNNTAALWKHPTIIQSLRQVSMDAKQIKYVLQLRSPRSASCIYIWQESGPEIVATRINGKSPLEVSRFSPQKDRLIFINRFHEQPNVIWKTYLCGYGDHDIELALAWTTTANASNIYTW